MTTELTRIVETFLAHCAPATLPPPWGFVSPDDETLRLESTNDQLAAVLLDRHEIEHLIRARIMCLSADGEPTLNQRLLTEDRHIIVLRDHTTAAVDILTSSGTFTGVVPLFRLLDDAPTRRFVEEEEQGIFVASCFEDLMLLRSLGIGAAPLTGLDRLNEAEYGQLAMLADATCQRRGHNMGQCECVAQQHNADSPGNVGEPPRHTDPLPLTFVAGNLSAFESELTTDFQAVARKFSQAERFLQWTFDQTHVWWPSSRDLAALRFYSELQSCRLVREFILKDRKMFELTQFQNPEQLPRRKAPPPTLAEVTANLVESLTDRSKRTGQTRDLANLRKTYRERVDTHLFKPMIQAALEADDAAKTNLHVVLADVLRLMHHCMPAIMAELVNGIDDQRAGSERELAGTPHMKRMRELTDTALKVYRQLYSKEQSRWGS